MKKAIVFQTVLGQTGLAEQDGAITNLFFEGTVKPEEYEEQTTPLLERAREQLLEYLEGRRREFDLPLAPEGTEFQRQVWQALMQIPYGQTRAYGALAAELNSSPRAVGSAVGRNPISILIPCHRVLGADGGLTGYAGGVDKKRFLLKLEGVF